MSAEAVVHVDAKVSRYLDSAFGGDGYSSFHCVGHPNLRDRHHETPSYGARIFCGMIASIKGEVG